MKVRQCAKTANTWDTASSRPIACHVATPKVARFQAVMKADCSRPDVINSAKYIAYHTTVDSA
eukprot:scaffold78801_cov15-Prasinocladus_malaysianus.AAC.1